MTTRHLTIKQQLENTIAEKYPDFCDDEVYDIVNSIIDSLLLTVKPEDIDQWVEMYNNVSVQ